MDKAALNDYKKQIKEYGKILKDVNIVSKASLKFGADNKNEVLNYLKTKYGEEKGQKLVEEFWD
jgi:hypothetical protein